MQQVAIINFRVSQLKASEGGNNTLLLYIRHSPDHHRHRGVPIHSRIHSYLTTHTFLPFNNEIQFLFKPLEFLLVRRTKNCEDNTVEKRRAAEKRFLQLTVINFSSLIFLSHFVCFCSPAWCFFVCFCLHIEFAVKKISIQDIFKRYRKRSSMKEKKSF